MMRLLVFLCLFFAVIQAAGQVVCTTPGQNPSTAFPVCGTSTFTQATVPLCGGRPMPFAGCSNDGLTDINPFWYKFTCFQSGTLGFLITPNDLGDDYDWELYDITNRSPNDVYTDGSLVISNNWSGETGLTGASSAGNLQFVCGGSGKPLFSRMPQLVQGHNYLLLISHFTNSQSGYKLSFGGGTGVITDTTEPHLKRVEANCGGDLLRLSISKKIKCNSIAVNGSDFFITPSLATVTSATGVGCTTGFDSDSLQLQLSQPLTPGTYVLHIKKGGDNNTLFDYCDHPVPETETLNFIVTPIQPTPMDSLVPVNCAPQQLKLIFTKPISCSSIALDGSDFTVNGTYPVTVTAASGACSAGTTKEITVTLAASMQTAGAFNIVLQTGSDGNTLIDECSEETPAGSFLPFTLKDTVNAGFTYAINYGCVKDTVRYFHPGGNGVNSWQWELDEAQQSAQQNATGLYSIFNEKNVQLIVSNGFCKDTTAQQVLLENYIKAGFSMFEDNCPAEPVPFTNTSEGKIRSYHWEFGDGGTDTRANPTHIYAVPFREVSYTVSLTITDSFGCQSIAQKRIIIYTSCYMAVPNAFTPNGDGKNDFFHPLNAVKAEKLEFRVFNRWGNLVYKTNNWKQGWNGTSGGMPQPGGVYVWLLLYTDRDTKKAMQQKGTVALIR